MVRTVQSSGELKKCTHENLTLSFQTSGTGSENTARIHLTEFFCPDCKKKFKAVSPNAATDSFVVNLISSDTPTKKSHDQADLEMAAGLIEKYLAAGGSNPETVAPRLIGYLAGLRPDLPMSTLVLGKNGKYIGMALEKVGSDHVVVTDDPATVHTDNVTQHSLDWKVPYGKLFDYMVVSGEVPEYWESLLPTLVRPGGDCFLVGKASKYETLLSNAWGVKPYTRFPGEKNQYVVLLGNGSPLGEGPGTEYHKELASMGMPECAACRFIAHWMNSLGPDGCRKHMDRIVSLVLPHAIAWWENSTLKQKLQAWWKSNPTLWGSLQTSTRLAVEDRDAMLEKVIREQLGKIIDRFEQKGNTL